MKKPKSWAHVRTTALVVLGSYRSWWTIRKIMNRGSSIGLGTSRQMLWWGLKVLESEKLVRRRTGEHAVEYQLTAAGEREVDQIMRWMGEAGQVHDAW